MLALEPAADTFSKNELESMIHGNVRDAHENGRVTLATLHAIPL